MSVIKNEIIVQENVRQKKNSRFGLIIKLFKSGIIAWVLVLAIWSIAASFSDPQFLPGPLAVWQGAVDLSQDGSLFLYIWVSFFESDYRVDIRKFSGYSNWIINWSCPDA